MMRARRPPRAMRLLASVKVRLFLVCWTVFSLFFATNVVREHYPAFALIERGDWVCDRYAGMHSDLFPHTDGHWYTGNNVLGSLIAVPPLLVFDPLLDRLEQASLRRLAATEGEPEVVYDTQYPNRRAMFELVKKAGLDLRFGASTAITSALLMAPLSAGLVVLMFGLLLRRGVPRPRAVWLALLFAFATPIAYRTAHLNHNMFLMEAVFVAFICLWRDGDSDEPLSLARRVGAGLACGAAFALDYAGAVPVLVLTAYLVLPRARVAGWGTSLREAVPYVLAGLPGLAFLLGTQWAMYGNPLTPGQFVMTAVNYTDKGIKGIGLPTFEVFLKNLVSPSWGLFAFAPLLLLGFVPVRSRGRALVFPRSARRVSLWLVASFLLFCAANWYSLMQFNTGFRYLLPIVPFVFLAASDHLARMPRPLLALVSVPAFLHTWVMCMFRAVSDAEKDLRDQAEALGISQLDLPGYWRTLATETSVPASWAGLLREGPQLPWLTVLRQTSTGPALLVDAVWMPSALMTTTGLALALLWHLGARLERERARETGASPGAIAG